MIELTEKKNCTGCAACEQICPVGAIKMNRDKEGFLFPEIDDKKCVSCNKCKNICPAENPLEANEPKAVYAARAKDEKTVFASSSGGMFGTLAKRITDMGGVVFSVGFDEDFKVVHKAADSMDKVFSLMGSKYVQSDVKDAYKDIENNLSQGRQVLFTGTPCQCAGLKKFLRKEYDNLLLVDFVCHGVPSPLLFEKHLEYMGGKDKIKKVSFRDKAEDKKSGLRICIEYKDGSVYRVPFVEDPYMLAFLQNISLRQSCYNCLFRNFKSGSDITIGDFWGIDKTDSTLAICDGVSLCTLNTEKGRAFFEGITDSVDADSRTLEEAIKSNKPITSSVSLNPLRDKYLKDMQKLNIKKLNDKYCTDSFGAKLRRFIAKI